MCTHPELIIRCRNHSSRGCTSTIYRDRQAIEGHLCRMARERGGWGLCKTGVEWSRYDRVSPDEECVVCELYGAVADLTAETCDEALAENVPCGSWMRWDDEEDDDDDDDDDGDDEDGGVSVVAVSVVADDDDDDEDGEEEGGVRLGK